MTNKLNEISEDYRMRVKDLSMAVDEAKKRELKLTEKLKNLENVFDHSNQVSYGIFWLSFCLKVFLSY